MLCARFSASILQVRAYLSIPNTPASEYSDLHVYHGETGAKGDQVKGRRQDTWNPGVLAESRQPDLRAPEAYQRSGIACSCGRWWYGLRLGIQKRCVPCARPMNKYLISDCSSFFSILLRPRPTTWSTQNGVSQHGLLDLAGISALFWLWNLTEVRNVQVRRRVRL